MKKLLGLVGLLLSLPTYAQQRDKYEFERNLPVYADSLIADLSYPLAWENSGIKRFDKWKKVARRKVLECMMTPPPAPKDGYEVKVIADEQLSFKYERTENGGFANCIPALRRWLDYPHIASLACPNAMLFINGTQDKLFPVAGVKKAFGIMHSMWQHQGVDEKLETELWDMPHSCPLKVQERTLEFFQKHLH
ncbi:MAG: hypothetical protein J5616_04945 [Bacteroidaceae bacterium]|nr:hypothetical protein [Bacteroidaceae bacterium]